MEDGLAEYLDEGCKQHTRSSRCPRCMRWYTVGYSSEPDGNLSLIPQVSLQCLFCMMEFAIIALMPSKQVMRT
jgi:hypothetical protein